MKEACRFCLKNLAKVKVELYRLFCPSDYHVDCPRGGRNKEDSNDL